MSYPVKSHCLIRALLSWARSPANPWPGLLRQALTWVLPPEHVAQMPIPEPVGELKSLPSMPHKFERISLPLAPIWHPIGLPLVPLTAVERLRLAEPKRRMPPPVPRPIPRPQRPDDKPSPVRKPRRLALLCHEVERPLLGFQSQQSQEYGASSCPHCGAVEQPGDSFESHDCPHRLTISPQRRNALLTLGDLRTYSLRYLRHLASQWGVPNYGKYRKAALVKLLEQNGANRG